MIPKFRAWHKEEKRMYEVFSIDFVEETIFLNIMENQEIKLMGNDFSIKEITLMQSTGLRDKNGKEIFEGDILNTSSLTANNYKQEVRWERTSWNGIWNYGSSEVIGNIYENPELLKERDKG